jgi:hypothetical protein
MCAVSQLDAPGCDNDHEAMKVRGDETGYLGRVAIMVIGLGLMGQLQGSPSLIGVLMGLLGLVLFLAAVGVIELGMAVWYRMKRHRLASSRSTTPR